MPFQRRQTDKIIHVFRECIWYVKEIAIFVVDNVLCDVLATAKFLLSDIQFQARAKFIHNVYTNTNLVSHTLLIVITYNQVLLRSIIKRVHKRKYCLRHKVNNMKKVGLVFKKGLYRNTYCIWLIFMIICSV